MFINRRNVHIEWGDCDPAGIVWYPRYFEMFDNSTQHLFEAVGIPKKQLQQRFDLVGFPMVDTRAKFYIPTSYGDDVVIETEVSAFRKSSFDVVHRILKDGKLCVEGFETRVIVKRDETTGGIRSTAIPQAIIEALSRTN